MILPCKHIFCHICLQKELAINRICPVCRETVSTEFQLPANDQLMYNFILMCCRTIVIVMDCEYLCSDTAEAYRSFRRCSTAFFMELVSVHSFSGADSLPPERELVQKLMELVVQGPRKSTRPFSPFQGDAVDPRPVVRSFILQLLLKYK